MAFAFGFSGDDIDEVESAAKTQDQAGEAAIDSEATSAVPVQEHSLNEWLHVLPSQFSFTTTHITSPQGQTLALPRRELFDIRAQLMAEENDSLLSSLSTSDISSKIYEGGFKTWECSLDLASLLLDRGPRKDIDELARVANVIELGAGSALPSLVLFRHALMEAFPIGFTVADFNADVLRLVTVPNLLLTWARLRTKAGMEVEAGDLEVTPELVDEFVADLEKTGVHVRLLSGPWRPAMLRSMPESVEGMTTLVLAAETIYSPASLQSFVDVLYGILAGGSMNKAYVAAKKFYFGVGGSVDALKVACRDKGMMAAEVENSGLTGMDEGVGRSIVEVQMTY